MAPTISHTMAWAPCSLPLTDLALEIKREIVEHGNAIHGVLLVNQDNRPKPSGSHDVRWHQRLQNYVTALAQLSAAVDLASQRALSDLEKQGLIQAFEFTHELAWNVLKDYFEYQSAAQITGSRDATREAFKMGLIEDGDSWMEMIKSRNQTSHTYNRATADDITQKTRDLYHPLFEKLKTKMLALK